MATNAGYSGSVKVGANTVAECHSWTLTTQRDITESTAFGSSWKTQAALLGSGSGSFDVNWDGTDTNGQIALQNAVLNGTSVSLVLAVSGTHNYSATAFITSSQNKAGVGDLVTTTYNFTTSGTVSYT